MNFTSDNVHGAAPEILAALSRANDGSLPSYGGDPLTAKLTTRLCEIFERDCIAFPVATGTAANALALATIVPSHGAIFCHSESHIMVDECGAPEFFTHGAKLIPLEGGHGRFDTRSFRTKLATLRKGDPHSVQPACVSITQASERGTVYRPDEISAIAELARAEGLRVHMDGARFANALVHLGCTPAETTWKCGVDLMSFGATKNGLLFGEVVIFFDRSLARDFEYRRKKSGHLLSKMRFVSAQLMAYLEDGRWLAMARHANEKAAHLAKGLQDFENVRLTDPVEANAVFASMPDVTVSKLRSHGAQFYDWAKEEDGRTLIRLVTSFATSDADVSRFLDVLKK